jgi:hypothetical protein
MVKRYTPETRISSHSSDHSEHQAICYETPNGEYVKYEEYHRVLRELNNLKFGRTCVSIAKKTGSTPEEVEDFAHQEANNILSGKSNKKELLNKEHTFYFKEKKLSTSDIKKILLKQ